MNNIEIAFIIDEAGDKGYSNKDAEHGIGVMAGFLIEEYQLVDFSSNLKMELVNSGINFEKKLHMSSLFNNEKACAIEIVKRLFNYYGIKFFFSAIYTDSFKKLVNGQGGMKKKESLHTQLLSNILHKTFSCCKQLIDEKNKDCKIRIISDNLDVGVIKKMQIELDHNLNTYNSRPTKKYIKKGKVIVTKVESSTPDFRPKNGFYHATIEAENSELTFISDILSHITLNHLKLRLDKKEISNFNTTASIKGHPLEDLIIFQLTPDFYENNIENLLFGPPSQA